MSSAAVQLEREKRKTAREERLWSLVTDPTVKRMLLLSAIVAYSAYVSGKENPNRAEIALGLALPTAGIPMLAAEAGITDWKALLAISAACGGLAAISSDAVTEAVTLEGPGGMPILSLFGPLAELKWVWGKAEELLRR